MKELLSFDNTGIAFGGRTDAELRRAKLLFEAINNRLLVKAGPPLVRFAMMVRLPIGGLIRKTIFNQFCGGETIGDCEQSIQKLGSFGIGSILDYSVEGKASESDFENAEIHTIATIEKARGNQHIPFSVFKVSALASMDLLEKLSKNKLLSASEEQEALRLKERMNRICKAAYDAGVPVFIDAEESWIQAFIDEMAQGFMHQYNKQKAIVYNTLQMYRTGRLDYLKSSLEHAETNGYFLGIKLVRGAYMEKERKRAKEHGYVSPIQVSKEATDRDYDEALRLSVQHINRMSLCAGTHNESSSLLLTRLMQKAGLQNNDSRIYFSQLYGMSDHISFNLAGAGYHVAKYLPYGPVKEVLPYLFRRAEENTSVAGQAGRELSLILKELKRRGSWIKD